MCSNPPTVRKHSEIRKIRKPLIEKKRRARINDSLEELKRLVLEAKKEVKLEGKPSKLEKADILELTVQHLRAIKREENENENYRRGFQECTEYMKKLVNNYENLDTSSRKRLLSYLFSNAGTPDGDSSNLTLIPTKLANGDSAFLISADLNARHLKLTCPTDNRTREVIKQEMWRPW